MPSTGLSVKWLLIGLFFAAGWLIFPGVADLLFVFAKHTVTLGSAFCVELFMLTLLFLVI